MRVSHGAKKNVRKNVCVKGINILFIWPTFKLKINSNLQGAKRSKSSLRKIIINLFIKVEWFLGTHKKENRGRLTWVKLCSWKNLPISTILRGFDMEEGQKSKTITRTAVQSDTQY